jgi:hypothetical protein
VNRPSLFLSSSSSFGIRLVLNKRFIERCNILKMQVTPQTMEIPCRSEPARDERAGNGFFQAACVIVQVHREQARSHKGLVAFQMAAVEGSNCRCANQISSCNHWLNACNCGICVCSGRVTSQ